MVVFPVQGLTHDRLQRASAPTCSPGKPGGELRQRNYPEEAIGKILGGNLLGIMRQVLPKSFTHA
jgi:hypothetical protein